MPVMSTNPLERNIRQKRDIGQKSSGQPYRAVIVEDSPMMRKILKQILLSVKFDVISEFTNGRSALESFKTKPSAVDYFFIDIEMPVMNGIEFVRQIRPLFRNSKIVMVTSKSTKEEVEELIRLGIQGYIIKPFDRNTVITKLAKMQTPHT
jgi:two-component system response regulator YesN